VVFGGSCAASDDCIAHSAQIASSSPRRPAMMEKVALSATNCRTTWPRLAPSDCRNAISLWRAVRRPRNSDATLAQAISSTKPTAPSSVKNVGSRAPASCDTNVCASLGWLASRFDANCAL
jgi:hypothetical protein